MQTLEVREGADFQLPPKLADGLRAAVERLEETLRPRIRFLYEKGSVFRINNLIGSFQIGNGIIINVTPKVDVKDDWITSVVSLLTGDERISIAGERRAGVSRLYRNLLDAIADIYLMRLEQAFRQDGPILLMERISQNLPYLHGKLDITKWAQKALWQPHVFPVNLVRLAQNNPYTRTLVTVAKTLSKASSSSRTRIGLNTLCRDLSSGLSDTLNVTVRPLPQQWSAYKPAWSIATAILQKSSLFGVTGTQSGVSLAVEPWPLLETLLRFTLIAAEDVGQAAGRALSSRMKGTVKLLTPIDEPPHAAFSVEPDGRVYEDGQIVATFEAKYKDFYLLPDRQDIYQALSTAAACDAPLAILVYPNSFAPRVWTVPAFHGKPTKLAAVGLDLFRWQGYDSTRRRAEELLVFINAISVTNLVERLENTA